MKHKIEAVILDWAGTAVDYGCFAPVQAFIEIFKSWGLNPTMEEIRKPMGMLKRDHIKTVLSMETVGAQFKELYGRDFTEYDIDQMNRQFEKNLLGILHNFTDPKPHVLETLEALRKKNIKIGSTTGYTDEMMAIVTSGAKTNGYEPDAWFSPNSVKNMGRPYPYMIFKNMEALQISSVRSVIKAGDTVSDILEGKNAGVITVGVLEGSSEIGLLESEYHNLSKEEQIERKKKAEARYREAGADYVIEDIRGILELLI
ncbi:phosphonoacetaldehyde hydrolase [Clostridium sp. MCC353]|uniref:phosphonoacetaldehyde hydrolase n=1 Tax=Clostridium sp. MCC353 TaxID=2592646 RepID=UPI001C00ADDC|nr:phosphonoacetaldehyde hydrolase [Clostridium sp. MCC353]MBT9775548.1 phosphonoacetaldehyde hydrolase [Clostridium sp. MCC353]